MSRFALDFLDGNSAEASALARIHAEEWRHLYREWDEQKALAEFQNHRTDGALPATMILRENEQIIGSVSVVHHDCEPRTDLSPWLASLYVLPSERGRGHGSRLVEVAIELSKRNKAPYLHVFTESAGELFLRHGFVRLADAVTNGHAITIFRREN